VVKDGDQLTPAPMAGKSMADLAAWEQGGEKHGMVKPITIQ
jgi:hypothetical protein